MLLALRWPSPRPCSARLREEKRVVRGRPPAYAVYARRQTLCALADGSFGPAPLFHQEHRPRELPRSSPSSASSPSKFGGTAEPLTQLMIAIGASARRDRRPRRRHAPA